MNCEEKGERMMLRLLVMGLLFVGTVGCAGLADKLSVPPLPETEIDRVQAEFSFESRSKLDENVVQMKAHTVDQGSTVVINVPASVKQNYREQFRTQDDQDSERTDFRTKQYFNKAEQQIEKVLIGNGFQVLSRQKLEAKLRRLRDESKCGFWCVRSQVSTEVQGLLDTLQQRYESGELDEKEFLGKIDEIRSEHQVSSAGRSREQGEHELKDIAEVIRAAESGVVNADYILQINRLDTNDQVTVEKNLERLEPVRSFVRRHSEIKDAFDEHKTMTCKARSATLNAKLVDVKSGKVVWIGEHTLNEHDIGNIEIEFEYRSRVRNEDVVRDFVRRNNTEQMRKKRAETGARVTPPEYEVSHRLYGPDVITGSCKSELPSNPENRFDLARALSKQLLDTIVVR